MLAVVIAFCLTFPSERPSLFLCRNIAAAERTLQKQLAAVKDSKDTIRPEFMQRLAGTLADVIARARQQEAVTGKHSPSQPDRMPEIISLLQTAFKVQPEYSM